MSAACHTTDASFALPRVEAAVFDDAFRSLLEIEQVGLVIPTIDPELTIYAAAAGELEALGTRLVISDPEFVRLSSDKALSPELLAEVDLGAPTTFRPNDITYPAFVKPRSGSSSIDTHVADDRAGLLDAHLDDDRYVIQQYLDPREYDEYTVDLYYSRDSQLKCLVPRLRIETRGGEVSKGLTVRDGLYDDLRERLARWPGARGPITLQVFANADRSSVIGIEVNARYGGGFPLTCQAGAHYPEWTIREYLLEEEVPFFDGWRDNLLMLRYDDAVFLDGTGTGS